MFFPEEMFKRLDINVSDLVLCAGAEELGKSQKNGKPVRKGIRQLPFRVFSRRCCLKLDKIVFRLEKVGEFRVEACRIIRHDGRNRDISETFESIRFRENLIFE